MFTDITALPLGNLLQPKQDSGISKKRKKSLVSQIKDKGYAPKER